METGEEERMTTDRMSVQTYERLSVYDRDRLKKNKKRKRRVERKYAVQIHKTTSNGKKLTYRYSR